MAREVVLVLALAGLAGASWWFGRAEAAVANETTAPPTITVPPIETVDPASAEATAVALAEPEADRSRMLELPDGTFVETLNGAVDAAPLANYWGPMPWSPIIGVERSSAGVDWYRHADGSFSTTQMVWRSDLGRRAAMTRVAHPGPKPATVAPEK